MMSRESIHGLVLAELAVVLERYNVRIPALPELMHDAATAISRRLVETAVETDHDPRLPDPTK